MLLDWDAQILEYGYCEFFNSRRPLPFFSKFNRKLRGRDYFLKLSAEQIEWIS